MGQTDRGLYGKFTVARKDGQPLVSHGPDGQMLPQPLLFILDLTHDEYAAAAVRVHTAFMGIGQLGCEYDIKRTDGSHLPGCKHHGCEYRVLDLNDPSHAPALTAYAVSCMRGGYALLAVDLLARIRHACQTEANKIPCTRIDESTLQLRPDTEVFFAREEVFDAFLKRHGGEAAWTYFGTSVLKNRYSRGTLDDEPWKSLLVAKGWLVPGMDTPTLGPHGLGYSMIRSRSRAAIARVIPTND